MPEKRWLLKSEPGEYSWRDLEKREKDIWDGVKNPGALKNIRMMKPGDKAFFYHTGKEKAIVGIMEIASLPYPDPKADDPRIVVVDVAGKEKLALPVTLKKIKESGLFPDWELVRQPRLSIVPVTKEQWETIIKWSQNQE